MTITKAKAKGKKLSDAEVKALKALALKIDANEADAIRQRAREAFAAHEKSLAIVGALKSEREKLGVSLGELSLRTGIAKSNLSRIESASESSPTLETLSRYASALGKTIDIRLVGVKPGVRSTRRSSARLAGKPRK